MEKLINFVLAHSERGTCRCGKCCDHPGVDQQPVGHTADIVFFLVSAKDSPDANILRDLIAANKAGQYCECDLFDGKEHGYMEVGGWIGDQGLAMQLMGLGAVLGLWTLLTPRMLPGLPEPLVMQMAGAGMVTIQSRPANIAA